MQNTEEPSLIALRFPYILVLRLLQSGKILPRTTAATTSLFSCSLTSQMAAVQRVSFVDIGTSEYFPY